jgi:ADP-dependent NAD(P)H-hydrate dehydratase
VILSSPYLRARQTARAICEAGGLAGGRARTVIDERLREREFGVFDGLTTLGIRAEISGGSRAPHARLGKFYHRPPGGESWADVILRLRSAMNTINLHYSGRRVLIVCHQVVVLCMRYILEELDERRSSPSTSRPTSSTAASAPSTSRCRNSIARRAGAVEPRRAAGGAGRAGHRRARPDRGQPVTEPVALDAETLKRHPLPPIASGDKDDARLDPDHRRQPRGGGRGAADRDGRDARGRRAAADRNGESAAPGLAISMPEAMVTGLAEGRDGGFAPSRSSRSPSARPRPTWWSPGPGMRGNKSTEALAAAWSATGKPWCSTPPCCTRCPLGARRCEAGRCPTILLPHAGEMASLLGCDEERSRPIPLAAGRTCAERYDSVTLVKGVHSHVVTPDGQVFRYEGGGPGLGVSGSGDTLAGIVGGLLARGADPLTALLWGVWCHGESSSSPTSRTTWSTLVEPGCRTARRPG